MRVIFGNVDDWNNCKEKTEKMTRKEFWREELSWFLSAIAIGVVGAFAITGMLAVAGWY